MKWMRERDLLIAQTMAFVQSVTGKKPEAEATGATSLALPPLALPSLTLPAVETAKPAPVVRPDLRDDFQSEIKARVANFRAHQERFSREREAYCSATMARVHAVLQESPPPRPGK
jgi:hypothetical protein